jgi:hypothetical protein
MSSGSRKKRQSVAQTAGGVLFGFEQQVWRNAPPPEEVVHQARPDAPVPAGDGSYLTLELPDELETDDPWAGIEDELTDDDPWADYATDAASESAGDGDPIPDPKLKGR